MRNPVIFCPLEIEARAARKALGPDAEVLRTGPGPDAMRRAISTHAPPRGSVVVLFGTAGGLAPVGVACSAARVVDTDGRHWDAPEPGVFTADGDDEPDRTRPAGVTILGVPEPVCTAIEKSALARQTGAAVVDCESHAFAAEASARGWRWAVVRAVTDDHKTDLPRQMIRWIGPDGRTKTARIMGDLIRNPSLIRPCIGMGRRTSRALRAGGLLLRQTVDTLRAGAEDAAP